MQRAPAFTYAKLCEIEAAIPLAYEANAKWFMTKKTFMTIEAIVDTVGQPVARTNYGISGRPERAILGRPVVLNDYMSSFATSVTGDTICAFIFNPADYILNTNYGVTVKRYTDEATDDEIMKAIALVDGKVVDKNSLVTVTVKKRINAVTPESATFDKYAESDGYVDVVVTAVPAVETNAVNKIYIGKTEVGKGSGGANWSLSSGMITLKKAYLATLDVGDTVFTITFTDDSDALFALTVTDTTPEG